MKEFLSFYKGPLTLPRVVLWILTGAFLTGPSLFLHLLGVPWYIGLYIHAGVGSVYALMFWVLESVYNEKERLD